MVTVLYKIHIQSLLLIFCSMMQLSLAYASISELKQNTKISSKIQVKPKSTREIIVLVHGLMRTSLSMWPLKNFLKRKGYAVYSYSYPSPKYNIKQHGVYFAHYINDLMTKNPGVKISFITHSLGGIIAREALSTFSQNQLKNIDCLIMLAPPNQGSKLARLSTKIIPLFTHPIKPLAELSSDQTSYVHHVPVPNIKIGIIAGRYDAKVPPEYARLDGQNDPVIVNATHTFIMNNATARVLILNFLETGSFGKMKGTLYSNKSKAKQYF